MSNIGRQFIPSEPIIIFAVVQVADQPAKKPSVWIKRVEFVRRYQKIKEFWLPLKTEGVTVLIQENHQIDRFKQQLRDSLQRETLNSAPNVYEWRLVKNIRSK